MNLLQQRGLVSITTRVIEDHLVTSDDRENFGRAYEVILKHESGDVVRVETSSFARIISIHLTTKDELKLEGHVLSDIEAKIGAIVMDALHPPEPPKPAAADILDHSIDELEISPRLANAFRHAHIEYIGELVRRTPEDICMMKNIGRQSLKELEGVLAEKGLRLGMDVSEWKQPPLRG